MPWYEVVGVLLVAGFIVLASGMIFDVYGRSRVADYYKAQNNVAS